MTAKDCGHHDEDEGFPYRSLLYSLIGLVVLVLLIVLLIFLILRPTKPSFVLLDATIGQFNATPPNLLSTVIQVTISSRNPNSRIAIYYQRLDAYASYRGQQITLPVLLPDSFQDHKEVVEWSPFLYGDSVPVSPSLATALEQDLLTGTVLVNIKVDGMVKWKVGTWVSGKYRLNVNCPAMLLLNGQGNGLPGDGITVQPSVKIQVTDPCIVNV